MNLETREGLNTNELILLIQDPWNKDSPLKISKGNSEDYDRVPILNQVKYFVTMLQNKGELALTKKGFLPTSVVKELYFNGTLKNELIEEGLIKVYKEIDCEPIYFTRLICQSSGIIKIKKNKISITKKGADLLKSDHKLFEELLIAVTQNFNVGFFDAYECEFTGQYGMMVTTYLLHKYGHEYRTTNFYAQKYSELIPGVFDNFPQPNYSNKKNVFTACYESRTFTRSLNYFGLLELEQKSFIKIQGVAKSEVFGKLISFNYKLTDDKKN